MSYSTEMRWFFKDENQTKKITDWFAKNNLVFKNVWDRADYYLLHQPETNGIKLREGKVEIKVLQQDVGKQTLQNKNKGIANSWHKYAFKISDDNNDLMEIVNAFKGLRTIGLNRDWIKIEKERLILKYSIENNTITKVADVNTKIDNGCNIEFTKIMCNAKDMYYTVCFESFGSNENLNDLLLQLANKICAEIGEAVFVNNDSHSYPAFIKMITA
jgi:hypothetical protein